MTTEGLLAQARGIYKQVFPEMFSKRNVVAFGLGYKHSNGEFTDELSLVVSVVEKMPPEALSAEDMIPERVDGVRTDVFEVGRLRAQVATDPRSRRRPAQPGISVGHPEVTAGTFGFVVESAGEKLILSNNHVLAVRNDAKAGDAIYQPGPADGGQLADQIATLAVFAPLDFGEAPSQCEWADMAVQVLNWLAQTTGSSHHLQAVQKTPGINMLDAAIARPLSPELITPEVLGLGLPTGVGQPMLGQPVQKVGRTTGHTEGIVVQVDVMADVEFHGKMGRFANQVFTTKMSNAGDSGSGILDMDRKAVGLLFAGSEHVTIFTPIQRVLDHFGVTLVTR